MFGRFKTAVVYVFSVSLVFSSLIFALILLYPVDVISNWTITIPKAEYQLGDELVLSSNYTKNLNVSGSKDGAKRYIECKPRNAAPIRIELSRAEPNRKTGAGTTGIAVKIPSTIPSVTLPTQCKFTIIIDYQVFLFRDVREENSSKEFTLYTTLPTETGVTPTTDTAATGADLQPASGADTVQNTASPSPVAFQPATADPVTQEETQDPTVIDVLIIRPLQSLVNVITGATNQ